jgi:hypothetical protein
MIKAKHFLDRIGADDGPRLWVESIGLTRDLREWRRVHHVLCHLGPPRNLWEWFAAHPDEYETFSGPLPQVALEQLLGGWRANH